MSKYPSYSVSRLFVVFFAVFFMLSGVYIQAQDAPTEVPTDLPVVTPTDVPTELPTDVPTDVPTEPPVAATEAPTEPPVAATEEATEAPTEPPVVIVPDVPTVVPEPAMSLLFSDTFDADPSAWAASPGWALVPSETGTAWQVSNSNTPLTLLKGNFFNVAVQARFSLQGGSAGLIVRQSDAGNYTASIDVNGIVGLYRAGVLLQTAQAAPSASLWRTLRLSAVDGVLRVAVDGLEVIAITDSTQLPMGTVAIAGSFVIPTDGSAAPQNTFLAEDFALSVKTNEIQLYQTPVPIPTVAVPSTTETPVTETPVVVSPVPAETAVPTLSPEPTLSLLISDSFDSGDASAWSVSTGWALVPSETGTAWQVTNSNEPLALLMGDFFNVVVQERFLLQGGSAGLMVRQSAAGNYSASIDTSGIVGLYRAGALLQQTQIAPAESGAWRTLRLSAVDGVLRVAVDGVEVIALADVAQLPPGKVAVVGSFIILTDGSAAPQNTFLADDFALSVKSDEIQLYPITTPTEAVTETATPPAATATEEPAARQEPTFVGKDTSAFAAPSADVIALAVQPPNDDFANAVSVTTPPFTATGNTDTTAATLQTNETVPNCGQNLSNSVWFTFTPAVNGKYTLSTAGSNFDTIIGVYTLAAVLPTPIPPPGVGSLTKVDCNDDANTTTFTSLLSINLTTTNTYYIQIGGYNGRYGNYAFTLKQDGIAAPAAAPVLTAPVDNFRTNNNAIPLPALKWNTVVNAHHYEIQIDDNNTFASLNQSASVNAPTLTYTVNPNLPGTAGTTYFWRVRALNINNQFGPWSVVRKFVVDTEAPPAPTLKAPIAGVIVSASKPTFTWPAVVGASGYQIDVEADPENDGCTFASPITGLNNALVANAVTTINYISPVVLKQGTYCWQVQSKDAAGNIGDESAAGSFNVFIGTLPANGAFVPTGKPAFKWTAVGGTTGYDLQISTDPAFGTLVINPAPHVGPVALPGFTVTTALLPDTYYWRVISSLDTTPANVGYQTLFVGAAPAAPVLTGPPNVPLAGSTLKSMPVNLTWNPVTEPAFATLAGYEVQIATNAAFTLGLQSALVPASLTPNYNASGFINGGTYFWRVRARFGDGTPVPGTFSLVRSFKYDDAAPAVPVLKVANKTIFSAVRPTLTWAASVGANSYRLDLDDDADNNGSCDFLSLIQSDVLVNAPAVSYMFPLPGLAQGSYCWRVEAFDVAGNNSGESATGSFSVFIGTGPANGAFVPLGKPAFTWAAAVSPTAGYDIEISTDPAFSTLVIDPAPHVGSAVLSFTPPTAFVPDTYYWRVLKTGETEVSTVYRTFFVGAAPAAPVLIGPPNVPLAGSSLKSMPVNLTWSPVTEPAFATLAGYEVQIATNAAFTLGFQSFPVAKSPTPSYALSGLVNGGTYFWRVRAQFGDGTPVFGAFSLVRSFKYDDAAPAAPLLTAPANQAILSAVRPTLTWGAVVGATSYRLDVDDDPNNDGVCDFSPSLAAQTDLTVPAASYLFPVPGLAQGSYCWRVRAVDAATNTSVDSLVRTFSVFIGTGPANGAFVPLGKPAFTWAAAVNATAGYDVEVSTDPAFGSLVSGYPKHVGQAVLTFAQPTVLPPDTYYWRVRKTNETEVSTLYRTLFVGAAPIAPVLTGPPSAPAVGSSFKAMPVNLTWNAITPPSGVVLLDYEVQIATNAAFTVGLQTPPIFVAPSGTPNYDATGLSNGVTYFWRVRARYGDGTPVLGAFSLVRSFSFDTVAPAVPVLLAPVDNSSTTVNPPRFTWKSVPTATSYNLRFGTTNLPTFTVVVPASAAPGFTPPSVLPISTYYWQVEAVDAATNTSGFSEVRSVKLTSLPTAIPVLNRFAASPIVLTWGPISWVTPSGHYEVQIDSNSAAAFAPKYTNTSSTNTISIPVASPLVVGTWRWRVRACSGANASTCGAWSTIGVFTIDF